MSRQAQTYITPEEYLALERQAEYKNEYFDGEIFAMVGASRKHNLISVNITATLHTQLKGRPCEVYSSDMRIRIPNADIYTYADVTVACGEPKFEDAELDTLLNPDLIVEVLSKSTASYDRRQKFAFYRTIETLTDYILVSQENFHVEHYAKQPDGRWLLSDFRSPDDVVKLDSLRCALPLKEIYDKVAVA
ncbi:MAG TPA: Uma2 family endonuclease [Pyrinomonadaceae bacterium]|jgi:Uma2 family endonuclease|nr:Uma2 family endonuclease [Pyrinomonadaceae bacterium]